MSAYYLINKLKAMNAPALNDKWARLLGIPALALLLTYAYHFEGWAAVDREFGRHFLGSLLMTSFLWEGNRFIVFRMRNVYPAYHQTLKRLVLQTVVCLGYTFGVVLFLPLLINAVFGPGTCVTSSLLTEYFIALIPTVFVISVYESVYFFAAWKNDIHRSEMLARENLQSQFDALKNQVDPHFLFNSLNTLAALIDENNEPAQKYLDQLSDVYRYVLLSKDRSTVTLQEDLTFLDAYIYLNKTRFRENLLIQNEIRPEYHQHQVAPLTLQMLVENAIKHNVVSKERPLTIRIYHENPDYITVQNNIQEKTILEKSTKVGLQNIINRYNLINPKKIEIQRLEGFFTVKLPLLPVG